MTLEELLTDRKFMMRLFYIGFIAGLVFIAIGAVLMLMKMLG